jgi:GNAT superfamily N-acetyltransferase
MSVKLPAEVQKFEAHIKKSYDGVVFELMVTHNLLVRKVVELTWIIVNDRKRGVGTAIMQELCEFADRHAAEISLKPASKGDYAATTSRGRLVRFYRRFGFVVEKAEPPEFTIIPTMSRKPANLL